MQTGAPHGRLPGEDADGRVDLATAQRIVESEVRRALADDKVGRVVAERVRRERRKGAIRVALAAVGVVVAAGLVAVAAGYVLRTQEAAELLALEAGHGTPAVPKPDGAIPTEVLSGRAIYERYRDAVYLMGYVEGNRIGGCCTAFAIGPDLLATNAHCVHSCGKGHASPVVTLNDTKGQVRLDIIGMSAHPGYVQNTQRADTPDVGLLRIRGKMRHWVTLASAAELYAIGPGDDAFVIGFPGRVMDPLSPSATFLAGRVGRVMAFGEGAATPDKAFLIQHDAVTRGGNSGSPVFDRYGNVMAVHAAHIDDEEDVTIDGKKTTVVDSSPYRVGMRVDLLAGVPPP